MNGECEEAVSSQSLGRGPNKSETTSSANIHTVLYYGMDTFKTQYKCKILNGFFFNTNPTEFKSQCLDFFAKKIWLQNTTIDQTEFIILDSHVINQFW